MTTCCGWWWRTWRTSSAFTTSISRACRASPACTRASPCAQSRARRVFRSGSPQGARWALAARVGRQALREVAQRADAAGFGAAAPLTQLRHGACLIRRRPVPQLLQAVAVLDHPAQHLVPLEQLAQLAARLLGQQ